MPLSVRALPLSVRTVWHYVFVLPLALFFALLRSVLTLLPLVGVLIRVKIVTFIFFGVINTVVAVVIGFLCFGAVLALGRVGGEDSIAAHWGDAISMVPSLALVWILWLVAIFYSGLIEFMIEQVTDLLYELQGRVVGITTPEAPQHIYLALIAALLVLIWGTCWSCATAVLGWEDEVKAREAARVTTRAVSRVSADALRALRDARMQKTEGPLH